MLQNERGQRPEPCNRLMLEATPWGPRNQGANSWKGERPKMATEPARMNWREYVGRFSVELNVTNHEDVVLAEAGFLPKEQVRRARISGVVDTGATRLLLPASIVTALGLPEAGQVTVRFADGRRESKTVVR